MGSRWGVRSFAQVLKRTGNALWAVRCGQPSGRDRSSENRIERHGKLYVKNRIGKSLCIPNYQRYGVIGAHVVQGIEAGFIHTLTALSGSYGFKVIGNEHDGIITIGEIPPAAVERAKELFGLKMRFWSGKPLFNSNLILSTHSFRRLFHPFSGKNNFGVQ